MSRVKLIEKSEVSGELAVQYSQLEQSRGGIVPNMFKALAYSPDMLGPAIAVADFTSVESQVPSKYKQLAYIAASRYNNCEYCLMRHSVAAKKVGLDEAQIAALQAEGNLLENAVFSQAEKLIIQLAEELSANANVQSDTFESLREFFNEAELVELVYTIASANMFNRIANGLGIELEPQFKPLKV